MTAWKDVRSSLVDWYTTAAEKTEGWTRLGLRHYDRFGLGRDIERQLAALGAVVAERLEEDPKADFSEDGQVQGMLARIRQLEEERRAKEQEIETLRQAQKKDSRRKSQSAHTAGAATEAPSEVDDPSPRD